MRLTGTHIVNYFFCQRKLWFYAHGVQFEHESDVVIKGKLLHDRSYHRAHDEIPIDGTIVLDGFDAERDVVIEVKSSSSMEIAHEWQLLYYLYYLKQKGLLIAESETS